MEIERKNLDILFRKVSPDSIYSYIKDMVTNGYSKECLCYDKSDFQIYLKYAQPLFSNYSENEIQNIYDVMKKDMKSNLSHNDSFFFMLSNYGFNVLNTDDKFPICKYEEVLNWRELSNKLGQDIITTAYLAHRDLEHNEETSIFSWRPILNTDNNRLHNILENGIAENHFHLNGSTQIFTLSWICIMNNYSLIGKISKKFSRSLDDNILTTKMSSSNIWNAQLKRAAIIRAVLFKRIVNQKKVKEGEVLEFLDNTSFENYQPVISALRYTYGYKTEENNYILDYALENNMDQENFNVNRALVGERYFLYHCFRMAFSGKFDDFENNLLYLYLVIKSQFRSELVQTNDSVGFKNFENYQDRKGCITDLKKCYDEEIINLALNSTLNDQNIKLLEARIMPKNTSKKFKLAVKSIDNLKIKTFKSCDLSTNVYKEWNNRQIESDINNYFYVIHFLKKGFNPHNPHFNDNTNFIGKCRNYDVRKDNDICAKAVAQALANDYKLRKRIKGIDGCSSEIGCRPEVQATELRFLSNYNPISTLTYNTIPKVPLKLRITYHVGEDFLDITDGLRAIDEAIFFIGLKRDDRLGHALALGIDVEDYYESKNHKVTNTKQDMLDNIIWLLNKAVSLNITLDLNFMCELQVEAERLLNEIYGEFISDNSLSVSFQDYYKSWQLRGDNPKLYRMGKYIYDVQFNNEYNFYCINSNVDDIIRNDKKISLLYYGYHYDEKIQKKGFEKFIFKINNKYIKAIKQIQHKMQFEVAEKGIAIECNPSSNYLIGTFKRFDKHPILKFYNNSLEIDVHKLRQSPQLCVSINTDDQGVFDTYLENEYAIMASALEKVKDENGQKVYNSAQIYNWIDDIRVMGLEQSFK